MKISERLSLNKISSPDFPLIFLVVILSLFAQSCSFYGAEKRRKNIATEIVCPNGKKFMVRYAYAHEVKTAVKDDIIRKAKTKINEDYTVIRIPTIESFHIPKILPEKLMECEFVQNNIKAIYPSYIKRFR